jgi:hypothetical protein
MAPCQVHRISFEVDAGQPVVGERVARADALTALGTFRCAGWVMTTRRVGGAWSRGRAPADSPPAGGPRACLPIPALGDRVARTGAVVGSEQPHGADVVDGAEHEAFAHEARDPLAAEVDCAHDGPIGELLG